MNRTRTMPIAALAAASLALIGCESSPGPDTREALRAYQSSRGLPVTGEPSTELLAGLR